MILTQEELDEPILNFYGKPIDAGDDKQVTIRFLMVESIFMEEEDRSGDDKLKRYHMANKVNLPHGKLVLEPDEVKFIEDCVDKKDWPSYIYGKICEIFDKAKMRGVELKEIPKDQPEEG